MPKEVTLLWSRKGPNGYFMICRGCGFEFESRGLKYCYDCYAALGDKEDIRLCGMPALETRAVGSTKRKTCLHCGTDLPTFSNQRKSRAVFCSNRCRMRYTRANPS